MNQSACYLIGAICFVAILIGFGISEIVILTEGNKYVTYSQECTQFPNITSFTAEKQIFSQWHWTYKFLQFDGGIEQKCPTLQHDTNIYVNGNLVARSDGKILSLVTLTYVKDCHGNTIYVTRTGNAWETMINGNRIWISFQLMTADQDQMLAYVDGTHFFNDDINIKSMDGTIVANLQRKYFEVPRKWQFNIYNQNHPGADPRVLSLIAGRRSFTGSKDDDTDVCNSYFFSVGYTLIAILSVIFIIFCIFIYYYIKNQNCCQRPHRSNNINLSEI